MQIYLLFQTDIHKKKSSRVLFGVFDSFNKANQKAKDENLYSYQSEIAIEECSLNEFEEI